MEFGLILSVSWMCFLLFGCGAGYPAAKGGQAGGNTAATGGLHDGFGAPTSFSSGGYAADPSTSDSDGSDSWAWQPAGGADTGLYNDPTDGSSTSDGAGSPPGLPWFGLPAGGADASFFDRNNWMPTRNFPDFGVWDSGAEMQQGVDDGDDVSETSPLPPSSYIIQHRNGFQRAREVLSHTRFSPEFPQPPPGFASEPVQAPSKTSPVTGPKGGQKV